MKHLPIAAVALLAACLSSILGGSAIVATRFVVPEAGVSTTVLLRFLGASALIVAFTLYKTRIRVAARDLPVVVVLGLMQFAIFPWFFTMSLAHVPAARGALVLATQPLVTLALAIIVGRERFSWLKLLGGAVALLAVGFALGDKIADPNAEAWVGDLYMFGAVLTGSVYNVAASFALRKYPALVAASVMVPAGAIAVAAWMFVRGDTPEFAAITIAGWVALVYLMSIGGAVTFFLWIWALEHTAPSRVALAVTFNPISAALLGAVLLNEPLTWRIAVGLCGIVFALAMANWATIRSRLRR